MEGGELRIATGKQLMAKRASNADEDDPMPAFSFGGGTMSARLIYRKSLQGTDADPFSNSATSRVALGPDIRNTIAHTGMAHLARDYANIANQGLASYGAKVSDAAARRIISDFPFSGKASRRPANWCGRPD